MEGGASAWVSCRPLFAAFISLCPIIIEFRSVATTTVGNDVRESRIPALVGLSRVAACENGDPGTDRNIVFLFKP